jgi:transcriptional regulator with XRE-family HTH domain
MDDVPQGFVIRSRRRHRGLTQAGFARAAGVSPAPVSRLERGDIDRTDLGVLRRTFAALGARIDLVPRWQGADLGRLVDATHAAMTEALARGRAGSARA